jgi:hypothetical protein
MLVLLAGRVRGEGPQAESTLQGTPNADRAVPLPSRYLMGQQSEQERSDINHLEDRARRNCLQ